MEVDFETSDIRYVETKNIEWRSVMIRAPRLESFQEPKPVNPAAKITKTAALATWLRENYPQRPALFVEELRKQAEQAPNIGGFSKSTFEKALRRAKQHP